MLKRALIYGGLTAAGVFAWSMLEFMLGWHTTNREVGAVTGFVGLIFPLVLIPLSIRAARRDGAARFGGGFLQGAATSAVFAVLGAVLIWAYYAFINREFLTQSAQASAPMTMQSQVILVLVSSLVMGLIVSAVAAAVMRRGPAAA